MAKNYFKIISKQPYIYEKEFGDDNILKIEEPRYKINFIIDLLRIKYKSIFQLDITIDESMISLMLDIL